MRLLYRNMTKKELENPSTEEILIRRAAKLGIQHLISQSHDLGVRMLPENTTIVPYQRFKNHQLIIGLYINTRVTK